MGNKGGNHDEDNMFGPSGDDNSSGRVPVDALGYAFGSAREGGIRGGAVSFPETLPDMHPMGVDLEGNDGSEGMGHVRVGPMGNREPAGKVASQQHGMDATHKRAGVESGRMAEHAMGEARGGYYHCMGKDCGYKTRNKSHGAIHVSRRSHSMAQNGGSSSSSGSNNAVGSSMSHGASDLPKFLKKAPKLSSSSYDNGDGNC